MEYAPPCKLKYPLCGKVRAYFPNLPGHPDEILHLLAFSHFNMKIYSGWKYSLVEVFANHVEGPVYGSQLCFFC